MNRRVLVLTIHLVFLLSVALMLARPVCAQKKLAAGEAKNHIGETATVCGTVASTRFAASTKGQPTFLNLDQAYPNQVFTVLIWGNDRAKFGRPEVDLQNAHICVTGAISAYRGKPEIVATDPGQIRKESHGVAAER